MFQRAISLILLAVTSQMSSAMEPKLVRKSMSVSAGGEIETVAKASLMENVQSGEQLLSEIETLVKSNDPASRDKIKTIMDIVEKLFPVLTDERDDEKAKVDINLAKIDECNADSTKDQQSIKSSAEAQVTTRRGTHVSCREEEKEKEGHKNGRCGELDTFLGARKQPQDKPQGRDEIVKIVEGMSEYWCPQGPEVERLDEACKTAEKEHAEHKAACDNKQRTFESGFCDWRTMLVDECTSLDTCYSSALKAYNDHKAIAEDLIKKWKVEWKSLKKIQCYVDVWMNNDDAKTVDASQYEKCKSLEADDSVMNIDFGKVAAKITCDLKPTSIYPGTATFPTTEYSAFAKYAIEPLACPTTEVTASPIEETTVPPAPTTTTAAPTTTEAPTTTTAAPTTTVAEKTHDMELEGLGCCRFDGWQAKNHGYKTIEECKQVCRDTTDCIAADVARPRGSTYDCYTFYGTGNNFNLQCGTSNKDEQCFKKTVKEGKAASDDPESAAAKTSPPKMIMVGNGCCRFDGWSAKNHGYQTETACQEICVKEANCVAADLARPRGNTYDCYTFYGNADKNFNLQCGTSNKDEICYRNSAHIDVGHSV